MKMCRKGYQLIASLCCLPVIPMLANVTPSPQKMIVTVPVTDLRCRPEPIPQGLQVPALSKDIGAEDSQVYFCESVLAEDVPDKPEWAKVSTLTQKKWRQDSWIGYPGFVLKSHLMPVTEFPNYNIVLQELWTPLYATMNETETPCNLLALGTRLEAQKINPAWWIVTVDGKTLGYVKASTNILELTSTITETEEALREKIVKTAYLFLDPQTLYVWGGRSPLNKELTTQITGVDCSGLTQLCYLAVGLEIPRDSGPQYRASTPLASGNDLKKADLLFFARPDGTRFTHVMMYVGDGYMIECYSGGTEIVTLAQAIEAGFTKEELGTQKVAVKDVIGVDVDKIESGKTIPHHGGCVFLGSYFGSKDKIDMLRAVALGQRPTF